METYGVCLEEAEGGAYSAPFTADLAEQLPQSCRWRVSYDADAWWDGDRILMAGLLNSLTGLIWGLADKKRRGPRPKPVGPKWATKGASRSLPATAMSRDELLAALARPRKAR